MLLDWRWSQGSPSVVKSAVGYPGPTLTMYPPCTVSLAVTPWGRNRPEGVLDASSSGLMRTLSPTTMTSRVMIAARVDPDARSAVAECRLPKVGRNMAGWTRRGHRWGDPELSQPLQASYVDRLRPPE